ncbi:hypothetical protein [Nonomuraea sp. NPDC005501]|uniref:hypothetical protein n=1 Tax=Nonomuraea sp. NPDC005501 TaxID=3156884 RepID=UPI0033A25620
MAPAHLDLSPQDAAAVAVVELRKRAEGDEAARAELALLGGDALIVAEALTRDRGSKEKLTSDTPQEQYTPYRAKPHTIIAALSATAAGRLMPGAALADWVKRVTGEPDTFALSFTVPKVRQNPGGNAEIVTRFEVPDRALEWDVFDTALFGLPSSRRADIKTRQAAARARSTSNSDTGTSSLETLQTQIHAIGLTLEKILSSDFPPRFATEAQRDELQQWVHKLGADVGKILFEPPPVAGDVYAYPEDGGK